jgi:hypothetical protein
MAFGAWFSTHMPEAPVEFRAPQTEVAPTLTAPASRPDAPVVASPRLDLPRATPDTIVGVQPAPEASVWPAWLVFSLAIVFVAAIGALSFVPNERVREWLDRWFKRAKVAAGGAERTFDSPDFLKALSAWHGVIAFGDPTPRGIKRFVNRVRLFAMRERAARDEDAVTDDATLVAMAALHHIDFLESAVPEIGSMLTYESPHPGQEEKDSVELKILVQQTMHNHTTSGLHWPPTPEQYERFTEMAKGIYVR